MATSLPPQILDLLLLGAPSRRRQLQDLPILGDVWTRLAEAPDIPPDLLIIPARNRSAADVATFLQKPGEAHNVRGASSVASLNDLVVATLSLDDLVEHILPLTIWWDRIADQVAIDKLTEPTLKLWIANEIGGMINAPLDPAGTLSVAQSGNAAPDGPSQQIARLAALLGIFFAAGVRTQAMQDLQPPDWQSMRAEPPRLLAEVVHYFEPERVVSLGARAVRTVAKAYRARKKGNEHGTIFQVTLNRPAELALTRSVPAIKGDAARSLFSISCEKLGWAVVDSGIDHEHLAFLDQKETQRLIAESKNPLAEPAKGHPNRILAAFDFTRIRAILGVKKEEVKTIAAEVSERTGLPLEEAQKRLRVIVADREARAQVDWRNVEPLIKLDLTRPGQSPVHPHGTHVAGIIGADWRVRNKSTGNFDVKLQGVCPDIGLYDFRVLGSDLGDSEFAVSAALQFIRHYNGQGAFQRIHGVNLSLAIRHNVRNYACGQTPVCIQAESLVSNGVTVVAAAGNRGYQQFQLADQTTFEGYASSSITDPGNADGVITVGATHRSWPHTFGVSFFSSRGPTGDGRFKPDLLAPGEKIESCVPGNRTDEMDGTSMAAPHVSGAAALLMARHEELKGQPLRIKDILCSTATDLKRERHFQGHGMVDVLRAIQSI